MKATDQLAAHNLAVAQAIAAERERCAKIADAAQAKVRKVGVAGPYVASEIAAAIRNQNK